MSCAGSVISDFSFVTNKSSGDDDTRSLAQNCDYIRTYLNLEDYESNADAAKYYHVKISSKTLKKSYVLPGGDDFSHIANLFTGLAELLETLKQKNVNPPRTDFTCFSSLEYNKVFLDVDCKSCKSGLSVGRKRHFSSTKVLNIILSTVARVFGESLCDGVYLTNGRATCGYHIFFNTLAYSLEDRNATNNDLVNELNLALEQASLRNIYIDSNCTQMPLPTALHANSPYHTAPYHMKMVSTNEWKKEKMRWCDMDADLLKCFSCIAFSPIHNWKVVSKTGCYSLEQSVTTTLSVQSPTQVIKNPTLLSEQIEDNIESVSPMVTVKKKRKGDDISGLSKKIRTATEDDSIPITMDNNAHTVSESDYGCTRFIEGSELAASILSVDTVGGKSFVIPNGETDDAASFITDDTTGAKSFVPPKTKPLSITPAAIYGDDAKETIPGTFEPLKVIENDYSNELIIKDNKLSSVFENDLTDAVSVLTTDTDAMSFVVPESVSFKRRGKIVKKGGRNGLESILVVDPKNLEKEKHCNFQDKQYKASLLDVEEKDALSSKTFLKPKGNGDVSRIYLLPGTSFEKTRKYKLLVRLENVKRAVYTDDKLSKRDWNEIKASYYDQHLNNPVILKMCDFLFKDDRVKQLFDKESESKQIIRYITHLMSPYRNKEDDSKFDDSDKYTQLCKSELVGALIRVCTNLFVMITSVVSDIWKIQLSKRSRNHKNLNCTVVDDHQKQNSRPTDDYRAATILDDDEEEEGLNCSASMFGVEDGEDRGYISSSLNRTNDKKETLYAFLASIIIYEENNLSDHALEALLYYYNYFPVNVLTKIMNEIQHGGLMVTAVIRSFLIYDHQKKPLTLFEIFNAFNDVIVTLMGPENYIKLILRQPVKSKSNDSKNSANSNKRNNKDPNPPRIRDAFDDDSSNSCIGDSQQVISQNVVTKEDMNKLINGFKRRQKMVKERARCLVGEQEEFLEYTCEVKYVLQAVVNYYLRPVVMNDDRLVFVNDGYDTTEEDAIDSCVAHIKMEKKTVKADVTTAFRDARTLWRMPHGSQLIYESDLMSDNLNCSFHYNVALKVYEMLCGGSLTRMKRVHNNYLTDSTRFNISVYDVVAECRTATVDLTSAIDRSYINLLLRQPIVPAVFEDEETRQLFMSNAEILRGSFCCLTTMDYNRALNLFDRANCQSKYELETCAYVERFLDDMYTGEIAAESPPNASADMRTRLFYTFYSLFLYEVTFNMRQAYVKRENCFLSIDRLCKELDVRELIVLFFGEASMTHVEGLTEDIECRVMNTYSDLSARKLSSKNNQCENDKSQADGRFDVRPMLAANIPDKISRMMTLFGQFGFEVVQEDSSIIKESRSEYNEHESTVGDSDVRFVKTMGCEGEDKAANESTDRWNDESKFEELFYVDNNWIENSSVRIKDINITGRNSRNGIPNLPSGKRGRVAGPNSYCTDRLFLVDTVRTIMRLELNRHIDHDRLGKLYGAFSDRQSNASAHDKLLSAMKFLPTRLKLLAFILTTHTFKLKSKRLAVDFVDNVYREPDGLYADERRVYEGDINNTGYECETNVDSCGVGVRGEPAEKLWFKRTETLLADRRSLLLHARWMAERRFKNSFFVGLDPALVYNTLYEFMSLNQENYPAFKRYNEKNDTKATTRHLCTAMMFLLIMSAYDQEQLELYLKVFLAIEWPGQWAKTIFVWKSNSNAGKSYLFDAIIKRACANSTCINDPKGGKENAPEKAEYVKNFVLFANEFSQANSNELKKIVSESTFKYRMNYGNVMSEIYATGKIMFNCNTLPPTSDEAAINRLTLFNMPFWFSKRQNISDALLNWTRGHNVMDRDHWEMAYRYELPRLFTEKELTFLKSHENTKNEADLFDGYTALRPNMVSSTTDLSKATACLFLVQNKISRLYVASTPPTECIVHGLVNITRHFSWLRFFNKLDMPVDFTSLPATSEAVRSEWLNLTLPYQEWKRATGARNDPTCRVPVGTINESLQAFASKKNVNYFGIRQFFESDFASCREAIENVYYVRFDNKVFRE